MRPFVCPFTARFFDSGLHSNITQISAFVCPFTKCFFVSDLHSNITQITPVLKSLIIVCFSCPDSMIKDEVADAILDKFP